MQFHDARSSLYFSVDSRNPEVMADDPFNLENPNRPLIANRYLHVLFYVLCNK